MTPEQKTLCDSLDKTIEVLSKVVGIDDYKILVMSGPKPQYLDWSDEEARQSAVVGKTFVEVKQDINMEGWGLEKLPDLRLVFLQGNFNVSNNRLTSLEGLPRLVRDCNAANNEITSLAGAKSIADRLDVSDNQLTSLENTSIIVGDEFICDNNKIESLIGGPSPRSVYSCRGNQLVTLEGAPQELNTFDASNNKLVTLEGGPKMVVSHFVLSNNNLTRIAEYLSKETFMVSCAGNYLDEAELAKLGDRVIDDYKPQKTHQSTPPSVDGNKKLKAQPSFRSKYQ